MYISDHLDFKLSAHHYLTRQEDLHARPIHLSQYYMLLEQNAQSEMYLLYFLPSRAVLKAD